MNSKKLLSLIALFAFMCAGMSSATSAQEQKTGDASSILTISEGNTASAIAGGEKNPVLDSKLDSDPETKSEIPTDTDAILQAGNAANSSSLAGTISTVANAPTSIKLAAIGNTDPTIARAVEAGLNLGMQSVNTQNQLTTSAATREGNIGSKVAFGQWDLCVQKKMKVKEEGGEGMSHLDAIQACGGKTLTNAITFENDPQWRATNDILDKKSEDKNVMRLSQFLFGRELIDTDVLAMSGNNKRKESLKMIYLFNKLIGDIKFTIEPVKGTSGRSFLKTENMLSFKINDPKQAEILNLAQASAPTVAGGTTTTYSNGSEVFVQPRVDWIYARVSKMYESTMYAMYYECTGSRYKLSNTETGEITDDNYNLDANPFEEKKEDVFQSELISRKKLYIEQLNGGGYSIDEKVIDKLLMLYLSRRSLNPLNPKTCDELNIFNDEDVFYAAPSRAEIVDPEPSKDANGNIETYKEWVKKNSKRINASERNYLIGLAYHLSAAEYYQQLISGYAAVQRAPTAGPMSGAIRAEGLHRILKYAGVDTQLQLQELKSRHLKQVDDIVRKLDGEY